MNGNLRFFGTLGAAFAVTLLCLTPVHADTAGLLDELPAQSPEAAREISEALLEEGQEAITGITAQIVPTGAGDDNAARYALSGLAKYATKYASEEQRLTIAEAFTKAMDTAVENEVKAFFIRQLELAGHDEAVGPISAYLDHRQLGQPAAQALESIGSQAAAEALAKALPQTSGMNKAAIIQSLGRLKYEPAASAYMQAAKSDNEAVRRAALDALAQSGAPDAQQVLGEAIREAGPDYINEAVSNLLVYAERIAEKGNKEQAVNICRLVIAGGKEYNDPPIQCAGLGTLAAIQGGEALDTLLEAAQSGNRQFRMAALHLGQDIPGEQATKQWLALLEDTSPEAKADILSMLGDRGDAQALPAIVAELDADNQDVQFAAIDAAVTLGGNKVLDDLMSTLKSEGNADAIQRLETALLQLPGEQVTAKAEKTLSDAAPEVQLALLDVLAARHAVEHRDTVCRLIMAEEKPVQLAAVEAADKLIQPEDLEHLLRMLLQVQEDEVRAKLRASLVALAAESDQAEKGKELVRAAIRKVEDGEGAGRSPLDAEAQQAELEKVLTGIEEWGFEPLFNGKSLSGWTGATDSYKAEDGKLVCIDGASGVLKTEDTYSDFIVRFEFKLTPGANNGLGIRLPEEGQASYDGIELQILDNTAEKYADLEPYQYHGSVYGIVPAKRGYLKPVGEWNEQEVVVKGSHIKVTLNGHVIVDADVHEAAKPEPMDGNEHPGLERTEGRIGFLSHGDPLEFRNIRIKELK